VSLYVPSTVALVADAMITAVGSRPNTEWLADLLAGLAGRAGRTTRIRARCLLSGAISTLAVFRPSACPRRGVGDIRIFDGDTNGDLVAGYHRDGVLVDVDGPRATVAIARHRSGLWGNGHIRPVGLVTR
jgi:hypothetical protein